MQRPLWCVAVFSCKARRASPCVSPPPAHGCNPQPCRASLCPCGSQPSQFGRIYKCVAEQACQVDRVAAYTAPSSYSFCLMRPISGCRANTPSSKSFESLERHVSIGCITISLHFTSVCLGLIREKASFVDMGMCGQTMPMVSPSRLRSIGSSFSPMPSAYAGTPIRKNGQSAPSLVA